MAKVTFKIFIQQWSRDIFGKDSYRGVTLSYSWLANQFGHFSLGFIPNTVLFVLISRFCTVNKSDLLIYTTLGVGLFWLLFEVFNVIKSIVRKDYKDNVFPIAWGNVLFDTSVDVLFFVFGSISASLIFYQFYAFLIVGIVLSIVLFISFIYWYKVKIYLQSAEFPLQIRLSQWKFIIDNDNKFKVESLLTKKTPSQVIIYGGQGSGKTSLAVAIATELSIKSTASLYSTAIKFPELCSVSDNYLKSITLEYWTWRAASCLIIDDINPIAPFTDSITPEFFAQSLDINPEFSSVNHAAMKNKSIIWVLGQTDEKEKWENFISSISGSSQDMVVINL